MRKLIVVALLVLSLVAIAFPALAEKRVALIVANSAYAAAPLQNPAIDAGIVEWSLRTVGFDVKVAVNVDLGAFDAALTEFAERSRGADVALFYYAGHGFAVNVGVKPVSVLMATDAKLMSNSEIVLASGGIPLDAIVERLADRAKATLIFIDACRNDPRVGRGVGGAGRGFSPAQRFEGGSLYIGISTQLGDTASDGDAGRGSPFARAFAAAIPTKGLRIDDAFRVLRDRVRAETGGKQSPDVVKDELPNGSITLAAMDVAPPPCGRGPRLASLGARTATVLTREETCALSRGDAFKECVDCPAMVVIPAGSFTMGSPPTEVGRQESEGPQLTVKIAKPFAVGKYPVTVDEFAAFIRETGYDAGSKCWILNKNMRWEETEGMSWRETGFPRTGSHPVSCVTWDDAQAYVKWLSERTGQVYRLLSESEWEYATRARVTPGTYSRFFFGESEKDICEYANSADETFKNLFPGTTGWPANLCADGFAYTSPVGHFKPNAFGLYDMVGNVLTWVQDCYTDNLTSTPDDGSPVNSSDCQLRARRGGSWYNFPRFLRSAQRWGIAASNRGFDHGFRVARTLSP